MIAVATVALGLATLIMVGHLATVGWLTLRHRPAPPFFEMMEVGEVGLVALVSLVATFWAVHRSFPEPSLSEGYVIVVVVGTASWAVGSWLDRHRARTSDRDDRTRGGRIALVLGVLLAACIGAGMPAIW